MWGRSHIDAKLSGLDRALDSSNRRVAVDRIHTLGDQAHDRTGLVANRRAAIAALASQVHVPGSARHAYGLAGNVTVQSQDRFGVQLPEWGRVRTLGLDAEAGIVAVSDRDGLYYHALARAGGVVV